jgi:ABC-2 type transport system ATP-binding protein
MDSSALVVDRVSKRYGARAAVSDLSFAAPAGSIFGILGPNGAGKSTTMRMIVGVLAPDSGRIEILGRKPAPGVLTRVGYLPEERGLYRAMTPLALIVYFARLKGVPASEARRRALALLEAHDLAAYARRRIKTLSKGMAQKVQLLATIVHQPDLLLLDEPFSGLDPVNQRAVEGLIRAAADAGKTVLFSTHVMEHAERMCDRIVLIAHGASVFQGSVHEALAATPRVALVETEGGFDLVGALSQKGFAVEALGEAEQGRRWRVALEGPDASRALLAACVAARAPLTLYEPQRATLHDAFVRLVSAAEARR